MADAQRAWLLALPLCAAALSMPPGVRPAHTRVRTPPPCCADKSPFLTGMVTNRDSPEARENQLAWAKKEMAGQVPKEYEDREAFVTKYIEHEKETEGRELSREEAEKEVDEWLLKQASADDRLLAVGRRSARAALPAQAANAPAQMETTDLAAAVLVRARAIRGAAAPLPSRCQSRPHDRPWISEQRAIRLSWPSRRRFATLALHCHSTHTLRTLNVTPSCQVFVAAFGVGLYTSNQ